jgi:hypothetical protein
VGSEAGAEGGEPEVVAPGVALEAVLQCCEDAWTADVAVLAKNFPCRAQLLRGNRALDGFYDIASTGVGNEVIRRFRSHFKKLCDRFSRKCGHSAVELVFEAAPGIDEADFLPVLGFMDGPEILETELPSLVFASPDGCSGSVAKEAEADEHTRFVIQVKSGGGNFHGYRGHGRLRSRSEESTRGFEKRQRSSAAQAE